MRPDWYQLYEISYFDFQILKKKKKKEQAAIQTKDLKIEASLLLKAEVDLFVCV